MASATRTEQRWAVYLRESQDRSGDEYAVKRQDEDCRAVGKRLKLRGDPQLYIDNDSSARRGKRRADFQRLLAAIRDGRVRVLVVQALDRFMREPMELEQLIDLVEQRGLTIYAAWESEIDLSTPSGRRDARGRVAQAKYEIEHKAQRQRRAIAQKVARGERHGGGRSFGYGETVRVVTLPSGKKRITTANIQKVNRREAAAIRAAFAAIIHGRSTTSIWREWNRRGLYTPFGNEWDGSTFRNMLKRPSLAGLVVRGGVEPNGKRVSPVIQEGVASAWRPIVDRAQWEAVQAILADPARTTSPGPAPKHLCGSITYCECGKKMKSGVNSLKSKRTGVRTNVPVYHCTAGKAGHTSIKMELLDNAVYLAVINELWKRRERPMARDAADEERLAAIEIELKEGREQEGRLARAIAEDIVSAQAARATSERIKAQRAALEEERKSLTRSLASDGAGEAMAAFWEGLDLSGPDVDDATSLLPDVGAALGALGRGLVSAMVNHDESLSADKAKALLAMEERFDALTLDERRALIASHIRVTVRRAEQRGRTGNRIVIEPLD